MGTGHNLGGDEEDFILEKNVHIWPLSSMGHQAERFANSAPRERDTCNYDHQALESIQVTGRRRIGQNLVL